MTKELGAKIPMIGANEDVDDFDDVLAPAKLFSLHTGWRWFITEWNPLTGLCFGLVEGFVRWTPKFGQVAKRESRS